MENDIIERLEQEEPLDQHIRLLKYLGGLNTAEHPGVYFFVRRHKAIMKELDKFAADEAHNLVEKTNKITRLTELVKTNVGNFARFQVSYFEGEYDYLSSRDSQRGEGSALAGYIPDIFNKFSNLIDSILADGELVEGQAVSLLRHTVSVLSTASSFLRGYGLEDTNLASLIALSARVTESFVKKVHIDTIDDIASITGYEEWRSLRGVSNGPSLFRDLISTRIQILNAEATPATDSLPNLTAVFIAWLNGFVDLCHYQASTNP